MTQLLQKSDLDRAKCDTPGCDCLDTRIWMTAQCHPKRGLKASYNKLTGVFTLHCFVCELPVAQVAVGSIR
jgi:hypothetical protein